MEVVVSFIYFFVQWVSTQSILLIYPSRCCRPLCFRMRLPILRLSDIASSCHNLFTLLSNQDPIFLYCITSLSNQDPIFLYCITSLSTIPLPPPPHSKASSLIVRLLTICPTCVGRKFCPFRRIAIQALMNPRTCSAWSVDFAVTMSARSSR